MSIQTLPADYYAALASMAAPAATTVPAAILANACELDDLRDAKKALEEREGVLRAALLDFLATEGVDSVSEAGVSISKSSHVRKNIDRAMMEALYPKILASVEKPVTVTQVRVKVKG